MAQRQAGIEGCRDRTNYRPIEVGCSGCHHAGECSRACPKGVDPAKAIQHLKRQLDASYLHPGKVKRPCARQGPAASAQRKPNIPEAPLYTVLG